MNLQAQMTGQFSGQVPNQSGVSLPGLPQHSEGSVSNHMQNPSAHRNMQHEEKIRSLMAIKIHEYLTHRLRNARDMPAPRLLDIARRLEQIIYTKATSKEEYMNMSTLANRLQVCIHQMSNHHQQFSHANSSSSVGTMIPTPGMTQTGSVNLTRTGNGSVENPVITGNGSGNLLQASNGLPVGVNTSSFTSSNGSLANGNNIISSVGGQRMANQMIPTPGFVNGNNNRMNNTINNNQSYMSVEPSDMVGAFSATESTVTSQPVQQKQLVGGQNSRILHNLGGRMGGGIRSGLPAMSYTSSNGGLGMTAHTMSGPNTSDGYFSSKSLQQNFVHNPRNLSQGDGYSVGNTADISGSGNMYVPMTSTGSVVINQNVEAISNTNSSFLSNQTNLHPQQVDLKSPLIDHSVAEIPLHSHQQFQRSHESQTGQLSQHQQRKKQQSQHVFAKTDNFVCSQTSPAFNAPIKSEPGLERYEEVASHQAAKHLQFSERQNQYLQNSMEDYVTKENFVSFPSGPPGPCSVQRHTSEQSQSFVQKNQFQDSAHLPRSFEHELNVQEEFQQRIIGQDEAKQNKLPSDGSVIGQLAVSNRPYKALNVGNPNRDQQIINQRRWILFLMHARKCLAPEGTCAESTCIHGQRLFKHMEKCDSTKCLFPRCKGSKNLITHYKRCKDSHCPVCIPVKKFLLDNMKKTGQSRFGSSVIRSVNVSPKLHISGENHRTTMQTVAETNEDSQPTLKRMKIEQPSDPNNHKTKDSIVGPSFSKPEVNHDSQQDEYDVSSKDSLASEHVECKTEGSQSFGHGSVKIDSMDTDVIVSSTVGSIKHESSKIEKDVIHVKQEAMPSASDSAVALKTGKPAIKGVSLTELFTPEEVREHIQGLRQWVGQNKAKVEKNQAMEQSMNENSCQLCAVEKLAFEPPPIYCTPCGARIKRNAMYYTFAAGDARHFLCIPCHNEARGDAVVVDGMSVPKARMEKKKNDEETEEWWVQCDKCEAWQHQICALFNGRRNESGQAEYTCPNCYVEEVERGERKPLPQNAVLGAKDLPRTILSDHIEQRLAKKLKQERQERARAQGKSVDEIVGVEGLVVRVVSSVDKKLDVKPRFLEIIPEDNYPSEFPYKSKVLLLFQKIEGVEVCLFGMYVQEFGSECQQPNHRRVYLSYLDSVKYFRPEIRTVSGEALRTFVYHEILIGYLEYCKKRGFSSCYIWACPPLKGEDYILYCHPEIQKTPKSDKLREWYLAMLRKASKENIVVELTNLYDHFFTNSGEGKAKITTARLPYFDGDYWPGAAEDMIYQLQQDEDGRKHNKKGIMKKAITKRALKAYNQTDLSGNASKDVLLMHKLGETISPMKEDFIMVHLQHACSHCCILMVSGYRWVCSQCKNFQLCGRCYESEQKLEDRERHPIHHKDKHILLPVEIDDVTDDTKDKDEILESEFFDTRQAFLSLCQGNHYQYDTLRRAKHSSMMVLYHLHNPTAPAFVATCNKCHLDIETGQGWRCETCPEYDVCNACYNKFGGTDHPHKLTNQIADHDAQNQEARQQRVLQLRKMLDLLVHASQCRSTQCQYPNCRKVKGLFRHGIKCKVRASGGCLLCKKMWYLLQLHARACKESQCSVPRCKDLKEHFKKQQQQSESRRRSAVMEMMRQRAAEVSGNG